MSANFQVELQGQGPGCLWHLEKVGKLPCCLFMCFGGKLFNFSKELMAVRGISLCTTSLTFVRTSVWPEILLIFNFFEYFISECHFFWRFLYMNTVFSSTSLSSSNQLLSVVSLLKFMTSSWITWFPKVNCLECPQNTREFPYCRGSDALGKGIEGEKSTPNSETGQLSFSGFLATNLLWKETLMRDGNYTCL